VTVDVGTGDGHAVLATAAREPATLVLGLDANAGAMAESSRRAARPARKGGLPNAAFILGSAEAPPAALEAAADTVTVHFPWGSLLRGAVGRDERVAAGVAGLVSLDGTLELLLAPSDRDGLDRLDGLRRDPAGLVERVIQAFGPHGLELVEGRPATLREIVASGSTWARRLGLGRNRRTLSGTASIDRAATLIRLRRRQLPPRR